MGGKGLYMIENKTDFHRRQGGTVNSIANELNQSINQCKERRTASDIKVHEYRVGWAERERREREGVLFRRLVSFLKLTAPCGCLRASIGVQSKKISSDCSDYLADVDLSCLP